MRNGSARKIAFGGMMAALALVIMNLGGLIPVATFAVPVLCMLILCFVRNMCGDRIGWAWYGAVSILSLMMSPDKEAAAVFVFLGYYPILKPKLDRMQAGLFLKILLFNGSILVMYWLLIHLFGMAEIAGEYQELGTVMTVVLLILGNVTFFLLDRVLVKFSKIR